jgi:hypothetical protein
MISLSILEQETNNKDSVIHKKQVVKHTLRKKRGICVNKLTIGFQPSVKQVIESKLDLPMQESPLLGAEVSPTIFLKNVVTNNNVKKDLHFESFDDLYNLYVKDNNDDY